MYDFFAIFVPIIVINANNFSLFSQMLTLTRRFTFEMAHALSGYDGACRHIHGHSYKLFVTVEGSASTNSDDPKLGMVIDFTDLKKVINTQVIDRFDHALVLLDRSVDDSLARSAQEQWGKIVLTPFQPTCENLVVHFARCIEINLPQGVTLNEIRLYETENSYVTYRP